MTFADKLRELRQAGGMTQAALSDRSGIPLPTIRDYEQGKREPLLSSAWRLARALGVSLDVFPGPEEDGPAAKQKAAARPAPRRGRPRKPPPTEAAPQRPRGRPRKAK
jgi:transcriptional regulator with XRE-family HTH domain